MRNHTSCAKSSANVMLPTRRTRKRVKELPCSVKAASSLSRSWYINQEPASGHIIAKASYLSRARNENENYSQYNPMSIENPQEKRRTCAVECPAHHARRSGRPTYGSAPESLGAPRISETDLGGCNIDQQYPADPCNCILPIPLRAASVFVTPGSGKPLIVPLERITHSADDV